VGVATPTRWSSVWHRRQHDGGAHAVGVVEHAQQIFGGNLDRSEGSTLDQRPPGGDLGGSDRAGNAAGDVAAIPSATMEPPFRHVAVR
jgi:hypothetical protein